MKLDLHGLNVEEATSKITLGLFSFIQDDYETELTVITGKGTGTIQTTFLNLMEEEDSLFCTEINGGGAYLVQKN